METKKCILCNQTKDISNFYYRKDIQKYRNQCKDCLNKRIKEKDDYQTKLQEHRDYYKKNREKILEQKKIYQKQNSLQIKKRRKEYYKNNKEQLIKKVTNYQLNKAKNDKVYKVRLTIHTLINKYFKKRGFIKTCKVREIIGCSYKELTEHLERTFESNYGYKYNGEPVHIDHIIPACTANNAEELSNLFYYKNLQYLKPKDNFRKNKRMNWRIA